MNTSGPIQDTVDTFVPRERISPAGLKGRILHFIDRNIYILFNIPAVVILLVLITYPVVYVLYYSLHELFLMDMSKPATFVGFGNYLKIFSDERFINSIGHTFYFSIGSVSLQLILGFAIALLFNKEFKGKTFYRSIFIMPMIAMPAAMSLVWIFMFNPMFGVINYFLSIVGLPPGEWIFAEKTAMPALILVDVWNWMPFMTLLLLAGLQSMPDAPFEAARIDGASRWQMQIHITLPLMKPHIIVALILRTIFALKTFDKILILTEGGPNFATETMNLRIYTEGFQYYHIGYAAALGVFFFMVVLIINVFLIKLRRRTWSY